MYNLKSTKGKITDYYTHLTSDEVGRLRKKLEKQGWIIEVEDYKNFKKS